MSSSVSQIFKELCSSSSYSLHFRHLSFNDIKKKAVSSQNMAIPFYFRKNYHSLSPFKENNNVVFPFPFHIFMLLAKLWLCRLQGQFPILRTRSCPPRRLLTLGRGRILIPGNVVNEGNNAVKQKFLPELETVRLLRIADPLWLLDDCISHPVHVCLSQ